MTSLTEEDLVEAAKRYLKHRFLETTVSMDVLENKVVNGAGQLRVNCVVKSLGLLKSRWTKTFHFEDGKITDMEARQLSSGEY
jgi:hypothetical protein